MTPAPDWNINSPRLARGFFSDSQFHASYSGQISHADIGAIFYQSGVAMIIKRFWKALWKWYGPLVITVTEALIEFSCFVMILKGSQLFLAWAAPELSCDTIIDCVHTVGFLTIWFMLVLTFVGYGIIFGYRKFRARVRLLRTRFEETLDERLGAVESSVSYNGAIVIGVLACGPRGTYTERNAALPVLQMVREQLGERGPTDRKTTILMGRLHRRLNHHEAAIAILSDFIDAKERAGERDNDLADGYYNRACTRIDHMQHLTGSPADAAKETAYADLTTSFEINPDNCLDVEDDDDFDPVRGEERFQQLCRLDANAPPHHRGGA